MEIYRRENSLTIERFLDNKIGPAECLDAFEHSLKSVLRRHPSEDLPGIRQVVLANNKLVVEELARRNPKRTI